MRDTVRSYAELEEYVRVFKERNVQVLFILGEPGQSKSTAVKRALGYKEGGKGGPQLIEGGTISAFELYKRLHAHKDDTFILDDCDSFYTDRTMIRLLKCLCQTERDKRVAWMSHNAYLEANGIPQEFTTRTRVVIIANKTHELSKQVESLEDRGIMLDFDPTVAEVLAVGRKFRGENKIDRDVLSHVAAHSAYIEKLSLRTLINASTLKSSGMARWKEVLTGDLGIARLLLVERLLDDKSYLSDNERAGQLRALTRGDHTPGAARSTWFELKARLASLKGQGGPGNPL